MSKVTKFETQDTKDEKFPKSKGHGGKSSKGIKSRGRSPKTDKFDKRDDDQVNRPRSINDIGWYTKYPAVVAGSSSHIFNAILGHKYQPIRGVNSATDTYVGYKQAIPGVVALRWIPWYSLKGTEVDAVNVASKNLYTYVRHANSGSVNYESSDMMQYILCVSELFAFAAQCKRDLQMIFTFKTTNRYLYQRILWATGYTMADIQDMIDNYAIYSNKLNILIAQLNAFKIPKEMTFFNRHLWLASHAWKDDDLDKATTYVYYMEGFYTYDWQNGQLDFSPLLPNNSSTLDFPNRLKALGSEINSLLAYEDIGIMLGDILKAYGSESCYMMEPLLQGSVYDAEYSKEVTHQIRNAVVLANVPAPSICQVSSNSQLLYETQQFASGWFQVRPNGDTTSTPASMVARNGVLYFRPFMDGKSSTAPAVKNKDMIVYPFLVIDADNPTNEEIILNTRLMYVMKCSGYYDVNAASDTSAIFEVDEAGTEVISGALIATFETKYTNGALTEECNAGHLCSLLDIAASANSSNAIHILSQMYKVDDTPQRFVINYPTTGGPNVISTFYYGKNVITVEEDWLKLLHQGCKMSEFTMPMFKLLEAKR